MSGFDWEGFTAADVVGALAEDPREFAEEDPDRWTRAVPPDCPGLSMPPGYFDGSGFCVWLSEDRTVRVEVWDHPRKPTLCGFVFVRDSDGTLRRASSTDGVDRDWVTDAIRPVEPLAADAG